MMAFSFLIGFNEFYWWFAHGSMKAAMAAEGRPALTADRRFATHAALSVHSCPPER